MYQKMYGGGNKNNVISDQIRKKGNESFYKRNYFDSLSKYNEALRYAVMNTKELGFCYGNRSAAFLQIKQFDACLENIQLARENNYPEEKLHKLIKLEIQCRTLMVAAAGSLEKSWNDFFKMSYPANPNIPFLADCVEVKKHAQGMFLATKRDLMAGDIIGITEPIFPIPFITVYRCNYCLADKFMNLIPCSGCVDAMFCNEKCMQKAINEFHQFECGIYDNPIVPEHCLYSLRIIMKCLSIFDGSSTELKTFLEQNHEKLVTPFDFSLKDLLSEKKLLQIQFCKHQQMCALDMNNVAKTSFSNVQPFLRRHPELQKIVTYDLYKRVVALARIEYAILFRSIDRQILALNYDVEQGGKVTRNLFGAATDICFNLFLHSCAPTVFLHPYNGKIIWIVIQPIKAGDWLTVAFRDAFFSEDSYESRKKHIPFLIDCCKCTACAGKWKPLSIKTPVPLNRITYGPDGFTSIEDFCRTSEEGIASYNDYCNLINKTPKSLPDICDQMYWLYIRKFRLNLYSIGRATWYPVPGID